MDVGVDGVEAACGLTAGVLAGWMGLEGSAVSEEHGGVPEGIVRRLMAVEILMLSSKFGARVCDETVAKRKIVHRCR